MIRFDLAMLGPPAVAAAAFAVALALVPVVAYVARGRRWVAVPRGDRWHRRPTPLMGGIAIYAAVTAGWILAAPVHGRWIAWLCATVMFVVGVVDDRHGVAPGAKLVAQLAAGSLLFYGGFRLELGGVAWLSYGVTLLWLVGVTNAINLLDNMDGLAAGVAAIAAASVGTSLLIAGQPAPAALAFAVTGAACGFLVYNFHPARIFMGDCGSLFLGFSVAALTLLMPTHSGKSGLVLVLLVPAAVMAVPILDTTLVTVKRLLARRPVSQGGRDHTSHRLVSLGLSEPRAVLTLYAVSALFGLLAAAFQLLHIYLFFPLLALGFVAIVLFGLVLAEVKVYEPDVERRAKLRVSGLEAGDSVVLRAVFRHKKRIGVLVVDVLVVVSAFVAAFYLRFDLPPSAGDVEAFTRALPLVVAVKVLVFHASGLHRGIWRYAGPRELLSVVRASLLASVLAMLLLVFAYRFQGFSRTMFAIDLLLATGALVGVRMAFGGLRGYLRTRRSVQRRVLLYGAGDGGSLALRVMGLRHNDMRAVGFVDDDPSKQRLRMHGIRVLGTGDMVIDLCRSHGVDEVILTTDELAGERMQALRARCTEAGVRLSRLEAGFARLDEQPRAVPARAVPGPASVGAA